MYMHHNVLFVRLLVCSSGKDTDSSAVDEEVDEFKAMEAKLKIMAIKKKTSQGT
jgi:hypothetical protein